MSISYIRSLWNKRIELMELSRVEQIELISSKQMRLFPSQIVRHFSMVNSFKPFRHKSGNILNLVGELYTQIPSRLCEGTFHKLIELDPPQI